jgi:putative transposase
MLVKTIVRSFLLLLARAGGSELVRQLDYLKVENEISRSKLPRRLTLTRAERRRLIKFGRPLGKALHSLISIVSPRTFARWLKAAPTGPDRARRGRPPVPANIRKLVLRLAEENAWGYTRILGELKKLGVRGISRSTVVNILRREGLDPGPKRGRGSWYDFLHRHADTLWACDFFSKRIWTLTGFVDCAVLFFIHLGTRRVHVAGLTTHPDRAWMTERAQEVRRFLADQPHPARYLIRDCDSKFSDTFDEILKTTGLKVVKVGPAAPNLNAHAERFVLSVRKECLDHFVVFGEKHLRYLLTQFLEHYHRERPHQGRENCVLTGAVADSQVEPPKAREVACRKRLGGLLKHYYRRAG